MYKLEYRSKNTMMRKPSLRTCTVHCKIYKYSVCVTMYTLTINETLHCRKQLQYTVEPQLSFFRILDKSNYENDCSIMNRGSGS